MHFTCGKGEHLWGTDLPFKHAYGKGFWLLKKKRKEVGLIFKSMKLYVLKIIVEKQTQTTLAAFLSTLWALASTSLLAADFSKTTYEFKDQKQLVK